MKEMKDINQESQMSPKGACLACGCGMNGHRHSLLRILLGLIIVGFTFSFGMKIGELRAELAMSYMRHDMMVQGDYHMYGAGNGPMMPVTPVTTPAVSGSTTPSATTTSVTH